MTNGKRPLPLMVEPHENESWQGYLARVAALYSCSVDRLGVALGLRKGNVWPPFHGLTLHPDLRDHAAAMLNLTPQQILLMHACRWDGIAMHVATITRTRRNPWPNLPTVWTYTSTPRTCLPCRQADPDYESLLWRLPWVTHCPQHRVSLIDVMGDTANSAAGAERAKTMLDLLDTKHKAEFAGLEAPARMVLRAWLECAALFAAAAEHHGQRRRPLNVQAVDHWLDVAGQVALARCPRDVEHLVRRAIDAAQLGESHFRRSRLYAPPLRDLIDSSLSSWSRS